MNIVQNPWPVAARGSPTPPFLRREDDNARIYLQNIQAVIRRRLGQIVLAACLFTAAAFYVIDHITPLYASSAEILVEQAKPPGGALAGLSANLQQDFYTNETEASVVRSLDLAKRVIAELNLNQNTWFNPSARKKPGTDDTFGAMISASFGKLRESLFGAPTNPVGEPGTPPADAAEVNIDNAVRAAYYDHLTVTASDRSRVISIKFVAPSAELAADVVNKLADLYIRQQLEIRLKERSRESVWLAEQSNEARERVIDTQRRLEQFRASQGLSATSDVENLSRQLADYNTQLLQARVKRVEIESRARQASEAASSGGNALDSVQSIVDNVVLQRLRDQQAAAARKLADLEVKLRPGHPEIQAAKADLEQLSAPIAEEAKKVVRSLNLNARLARDQEVALLAQIRDLRTEIADRSEAESSLRTLQVELKTNSQLYETLLNRLKEANVVDERIQQADARVISAASPSARPFYPNKPMLVVTAAIVGLMIAVGLAFLLEFLEPGFRTLKQIENLTGLETAGMVFISPVRGKGNLTPQTLLKRYTTSAFAEAIRSMRVALTLRHGLQQTLTLAVTSAVPGEGKSFTSIVLASSFAGAGKRVILIDCDIRDPVIAQRLGAARAPGLADYLQDDDALALEKFVHVDKETGMHFIGGTHGRTDLDPPILLSSPKMEAMVAALKKHFDVIILDTPPVALFSDTLLLQRLVDQVLICVRWGKTAREVAVNSMKLLSQFNPAQVAVALTQVDPKRQSQFDGAQPRYGSFEKYYGRHPVAAPDLNIRGK
jgi:capsular exopolysaccharide synthesis family protein